MSNIPCKNCIIFAICNAQMSDDRPFEDVLDKLAPKCSLIKEYIECNKYFVITKIVIQVAKFFKPKSSFVEYAPYIYKYALK